MSLVRSMKPSFGQFRESQTNRDGGFDFLPEVAGCVMSALFHTRTVVSEPTRTAAGLKWGTSRRRTERRGPRRDGLAREAWKHDCINKEPACIS